VRSGAITALVLAFSVLAGAASVETIVISEIDYHPVDSSDGEFIGLFNLVEQTVDIPGYYLAGGVSFVFPE
jgi:hypothetical protein